MAEVFVSHSSQDREFVEREIVAFLARHGIETWYAKEDIATAQDWERSIIRALNACDWFLVVLSQRSVASEWVRNELHWAIANRPGRVIPILIEECDPVSLHLALPTLQYVDFWRDPAQARRELLETFVATTDHISSRVVLGPGAVRAPPEDGQKRAFISYRRHTGADAARVIKMALDRRGVDAFLDVDDLGACCFDDGLLEEIERSPNFVLVLTPGSLDGCSEEEDWLRREIRHAMQTRRNIIPVVKDGFTFPAPANLPSDIAELRRYNAIQYSHQYFEAAMDRILRFLKA